MAEFDSVIPAGGSGQLTAKVQTKQGTSARLAKSVVVQTDAPGAEQLRLVVSFKVVTPIVVTPAHRVYLNTVEGQSQTERVLLHRNDGQPLRATLAAPALATGLSARILPFDTAPVDPGRGPTAVAGDQWLEVSVDAVSGPMNHNGVIGLATDHPELPRLEVPLIVRVRPLIDVRPAMVQLWLPDGGPDRTSALVRLSHAGRQSFEITAVEVADPSSITAQVVGTGARQIHSLRVALTDEVSFDGDSVRTSLRVLTSESAKPELLVPVQIHARDPSRRHTTELRPAGPSRAPAAAAGGG